MADPVQYTSSVTWEGGRVTAAAGRGAASGVNKALERLRSLSVPLAPIDRGPLRSSATVREATPLRPEGVLFYDTPYAVRQHEETEYRHTPGRNGEPAGQAKYLEEPLEQSKRELQAMIAEEVRLAIVRA